MSEIEDAIQRNRARIDDAESRVLADLIRLYQNAYDRVAGDLLALTRRIDQARVAGEVVNPDWLRRQGRYRSLLASIDMEFLRFGGEARRQLASGQQQAAAIGTASATEQAHAAGYEVDVGNRAPVTTQAQERLVSALQPDSPLADVIGSYGADMRSVIEEELFSGLAEGVSPREVERAIRQRIGGDAVRWRLAALARTEMMRANRGALVDQYGEMGVRRVVWRAARSTRTCLACLALDGTEYDMDRAPDSFHVNCRCILSPVPANLFPEARDAVETGAEWFDSLPVDTQRSMMPTQAALDAYQSKQITLKDFIGERRDPVWGTSIFQRSSRQVLEEVDAVDRHPANRRVGRGPSGVWGEDEAPVVDWEVPSERRIVPDDIVEIMNASSPVARVDVDTARKQQRGKHRDTFHLWSDFDSLIRDWEWWRKQRPEEARANAYERWQFVQSVVDADTPEGWPLLTVLEKQPDGSIKIVTSHRRRQSFWIPIRDGDQYHRRGQE